MIVSVETDSWLSLLFTVSLKPRALAEMCPTHQLLTIFKMTFPLYHITIIISSFMYVVVTHQNLFSQKYLRSVSWPQGCASFRTAFEIYAHELKGSQVLKNDFFPILHQFKFVCFPSVNSARLQCVVYCCSQEIYLRLRKQRLISFPSAVYAFHQEK